MQEDLVAETNGLLQRFLKVEEERAAEAAEAKAKFDKEMAEMEASRKEKMRSALIERGLPEDAADLDADFEARLREAQKESQIRLEEAKVRDQDYKEQFLAELQQQTELLRQIAEKLA
jgi:hypothetical protein